MHTRPDTTLIITGAPAAGKTTVCEWVREVYHSQLELRVDTVLRQMHASGELPNAETTEDGALYLSDPGTDVPRAMSMLMELRASSKLDALIELPLDDGWFECYLDEYPDLADRTSVLCLSAPLEVRLQRNDGRQATRIPPANLAVMPSSLSPGVVERIIAQTQSFQRIETTGSRSRVREMSIAWAKEELDRAMQRQRRAH